MKTTAQLEAERLLGSPVDRPDGRGTYDDPLINMWYYPANATRAVVEGLLAEIAVLRARLEPLAGTIYDANAYRDDPRVPIDSHTVPQPIPIDTGKPASFDTYEGPS